METGHGDRGCPFGGQLSVNITEVDPVLIESKIFLFAFGDVRQDSVFQKLHRLQEVSQRDDSDSVDGRGLVKVFGRNEKASKMLFLSLDRDRKNAAYRIQISV